MRDESLESTRTRFVTGAMLAWIPFLLFFVLAILNAFRSIGENKATGLGAVAGGLTEGLVIFGFAALAISGGCFDSCVTGSSSIKRRNGWPSTRN